MAVVVISTRRSSWPACRPSVLWQGWRHPRRDRPMRRYLLGIPFDCVSSNPWVAPWGRSLEDGSFPELRLPVSESIHLYTNYRDAQVAGCCFCSSGRPPERVGANARGRSARSTDGELRRQHSSDGVALMGVGSSFPPPAVQVMASRFNSGGPRWAVYAHLQQVRCGLSRATRCGEARLSRRSGIRDPTYTSM